LLKSWGADGAFVVTLGIRHDVVGKWCCLHMRRFILRGEDIFSSPFQLSPRPPAFPCIFLCSRWAACSNIPPRRALSRLGYARSTSGLKWVCNKAEFDVCGYAHTSSLDWWNLPNLAVHLDKIAVSGECESREDARVSPEPSKRRQFRACICTHCRESNCKSSFSAIVVV